MNPIIQKKASRYDVIEHDDKGLSIDTDKITDADFEKTRQVFKDRKIAGGKWDKLCEKIGLPHSSTVQQVFDKLGKDTWPVKSKLVKAYIDTLA